MATQEPRQVEEYSGWAEAGTFFAAVMLVMVGFFHGISGFAAILDDDFFVVTSQYVFDLDVTAWGWVHLILGAVLILSGVYIMTGATWARIVGITIAMLSAVANFFFIPYYPFWSIVIIAVDVWVIWSLTKPVGRGAEQ
jgi:hypothetical protein